MSKGKSKIFQGKFLTLGLTAIIAISVFFIDMSEASALNIKSINFIGSNPNLKINVTIENTNTFSVPFNITLKDTSNNEDKQIIYSSSMSIDANTTQSYTFGKYESYDYSLNNNWENFRCGKHTIEVKINYNSASDTEANEIDLDADTFNLTFSPNIETGKVSLKDRVYVTVKDIDGQAISSASVKISDGDVTKTVGTTNSVGQVSFRISELFS